MKKIIKLGIALLLVLAAGSAFAQVPSGNPFGNTLYTTPNTGGNQNVSQTVNNPGGITVTGAPQAVCNQGGLSELLCKIQNLINAAVPVLIALGVVYFVWGVVQYVVAGGEEAKKAGRDRVIYGIIGLSIIVGLWGIVNLVVNTFVDSPQTITVPQLVPTSTQAVGQGCDLGTSPKLQDFLRYGTCIIQNAVIPLLFALAIAFFIWGIIQYVILGSGEEAKRSQGRSHMIWGIIALAVMLGVWGLVGIVTRTFGPDIRVLPQVRPN